MDLRPKKLTGKVGEASLNRATSPAQERHPFDPKNPMVTSGVRSHARGHHARFRHREFRSIASDQRGLDAPPAPKPRDGNAAVEAAVKAKVLELCPASRAIEARAP